jgi:hypothetical protein
MRGDSTTSANGAGLASEHCGVAATLRTNGSAGGRIDTLLSTIAELGRRHHPNFNPRLPSNFMYTILRTKDGSSDSIDRVAGVE